jgi:hypothetical protein
MIKYTTKFLYKIYNIFSIKDLINSIKVNKRINLIDYFILVIIIFTFVDNFICLVSHIIQNFNVDYHIFYMVEPNTTQASTSTTNTTIIHEDGS